MPFSTRCASFKGIQSTKPTLELRNYDLCLLWSENVNSLDDSLRDESHSAAGATCGFCDLTCSHLTWNMSACFLQPNHELAHGNQHHLFLHSTCLNRFVFFHNHQSHFSVQYNTSLQTGWQCLQTARGSAVWENRCKGRGTHESHPSHVGNHGSRSELFPTQRYGSPR